jgi:phosphatidylglycerophosphatase A
MLIATAGGLGWLRPGPGTWGTLGAAAFAAALIPVAGWPLPLWSGLAAVATIAGLLAIPAAQRRLGVIDPPQVVIDEVAGLWLALAMIPSGVAAASPWLALALAVAMFRLLDIAKPWPLDALERLPGAIGVMADDLAAGLLTGLACSAFLS